MKKTFFSLVSVTLAGCVALCGCGTTGSTSTSSSSNSALTTGAALASALLSSQSSSTSTSTAASVANTALSAVSNGSLISGVIGLLTGTTSTSTSIVGTWTYSEPTVQFESSNLLAQAGGVVAAQTIVSKINPYYQKFGIKSGSMKLVFTSSNTCTITLGSKTISGTYTYNSSTNTLTMKDQLGLMNLTAYVTLSSSQLALTFDSSKLLTLTTAMGGTSSTNSTLSAISNLANSYSGMKTGFMFNKQ